MNILGISAGFHDAAVAVINDSGQILFAAHSERYSKRKNDPDIHQDLIWDLSDCRHIDHIAYYERPWLKQLRQLYSGQGVEWSKLTARQIIKKQLQGYFSYTPISSHSHHLAHAAGGFQTSPFDRATVVVIDAVGEWDTATIWAAEYVDGRAQYRRLWRQLYPRSVGLFYSAVTQRIGLRPMDEEYITMGMSAYGTACYSNQLHAVCQDNLHAGLDQNFLPNARHPDIAASGQVVCEEMIYSIMRQAQSFGWSKNLVYSGGVALNCVANRKLGEYFEKIWIMPCPGDSGSSLGAAALVYRGPIQFRHAFWAESYLDRILYMPLWTTSWLVDSVVSPRVRQSLAPVRSGTAAYSQTREEQI